MMIEDDKLDREKIAKSINEVCQAGADQIVLGCTHYHWIEELIKDIATAKVRVIQPEQPVINQLKRVIEQLS
jgi:glutamate racemase